MSEINSANLEAILGLLGAVMLRNGRPPLDIVVCGGSALIALGLVGRSTQDVDVLALREGSDLVCARPLPGWLKADADAVARELSLPREWLNDGPADPDLFRLGLPLGVAERLVHRAITASLTVSYISRLDQIHFKLYAAADQGGRHFQDLKRLQPTAEELRTAALWTFSQDASDPFRSTVAQIFSSFGYGILAE